jgi:hypothetical protein
MLVAGIALEQAPVAIAGGAGHLVAGPIVHAAHGNWRQFGDSLAITLGLALGGSLVGLAVREGAGAMMSRPQGSYILVFLPALFGGTALLGANLADGIALAYEDDDIGSGEPRIRLVPSAGRERAGLALAGQF